MRRAHLEGGGGGGGVAAGGRGERQHGAMSPQTGLGAVAGISLCIKVTGEAEKGGDAAARGRSLLAKAIIVKFHGDTL